MCGLVELSFIFIKDDLDASPWLENEGLMDGTKGRRTEQSWADGARDGPGSAEDRFRLFDLGDSLRLPGIDDPGLGGWGREFLNSGRPVIAGKLAKSSNNEDSWDLVAHPVTQVIGEQALVDFLDLSEVAWTCWGVSTPCSGLGLRMVKELDLQLALGMNERR